jgi:peptidoglycan LD-endopeptidase CwlK
MSAGTHVSATVSRDLSLLAPRFRAAVEQALAECNSAPNNLNAMVFEAYRSLALQRLYYARGRTVIPPTRPVTNARTNLESWHGYGLAVDVIHRTRHWDAGDAWFRAVAEIFLNHGCKWGGHWRQRDLPHFQWGRCRPSPSDRARLIVSTQGIEGVWREVGAD